MNNNDKIYDFYLAGPFFTHEQLHLQECIESIMLANGVKCFSPRKDAGTLGNHPSLEQMQKVFKADLDAIDKCKVLFANVSYRDTGTSVEIGYALSKGIPIVLFWHEALHDKDTINLMIAASCGGVYIKDFIQLASYLISGKLPNNNLQFNVE